MTEDKNAVIQDLIHYYDSNHADAMVNGSQFDADIYTALNEVRDRWKTGKQWCDKFDIEMGSDIVDPDGWRFESRDFKDEYITKKEFVRRLCECTCQFHNVNKEVFIGGLKVGEIL